MKGEDLAEEEIFYKLNEGGRFGRGGDFFTHLNYNI
tara:strand:+ start:656 stop:763 length:108 start_codon:yes stop_codon:yes gene_type:complete